MKKATKIAALVFWWGLTLLFLASGNWLAAWITAPNLDGED
jgi:hypothetical protein